MRILERGPSLAPSLLGTSFLRDQHRVVNLFFCLRLLLHGHQHGKVHHAFLDWDFSRWLLSNHFDRLLFWTFLLRWHIRCRLREFRYNRGFLVSTGQNFLFNVRDSKVVTHLLIEQKVHVWCLLYFLVFGGSKLLRHRGLSLLNLDEISKTTLLGSSLAWLIWLGFRNDTHFFHVLCLHNFFHVV